LKEQVRGVLFERDLADFVHAIELSVPVSMMLLPKVNLSTIAAQRLGTVKVFVQPEKESLDAILSLFFSSVSLSTGKRRSAPRRHPVR